MIDEPNRILVTRFSSLGDIVMAVPVAMWLRRRFSSARLIWLVDKGYEPVVASVDEVDGVVGYDYLGSHAGPGGVAALARGLGQVDIMIDLQNKVRTWILASQLQPRMLVRRQQRKGFGLLRALVGRDAIMRAPHQVMRNLGLLKSLGWNGEAVVPRLRQKPCPYVEQMLKGNGRPLVGLVAGTRHFTKSWPLEHWFELARCLENKGLRIALVGGFSDTALIEEIASNLSVKPITYCSAGIEPLLALIAKCRVVVAPDTGPGHVAAALGIPVVSLFGPTSPERWAPLGGRVKVVRNHLPCSPCSNHGQSHCPLGTHECMEGLEPARVLSAVESLVGS